MNMLVLALLGFLALACLLQFALHVDVFGWAKRQFKKLVNKLANKLADLTKE